MVKKITPHILRMAKKITAYTLILSFANALLRSPASFPVVIIELDPRLNFKYSPRSVILLTYEMNIVLVL